MPGSDIDGWIDQVRKIETLDFDIFAPAHGDLGVKDDATDARVYMETLRKEVLDGLKAGKRRRRAGGRQITLDDYSDWGQYGAWREPNIRGMARFLTNSGQVN